ncbi:transmembrane protein 94-like isoform X2 [Liolophura sinensis]|uniref:transmembrane protein 94-like isoform X2 n=1 Tax=Liolophura sinensis TaxID=3198878 RepID=UPI0031581515
MASVNLQMELEGLSTRQALMMLYEEIEAELKVFKSAFKSARWKLPFQVFRMSNTKSSFHWSSIILLVLCAGFLLVAYGVPISVGGEEKFYKDPWWTVEALVLLVILALSCYLTGWDYSVEKEEVARLLEQALDKVKDCYKSCTWNGRNYPDIHSPLSPSVSLQWTLREGEVVNMPKCLLVKGDIVLLRPGQLVPAMCRSLEDYPSEVTLSGGEVFAPGEQKSSESFSLPQGRTPLKAQKFLLLETPYIYNLRQMLRRDRERPVSVVDNERYYVCTVWLERRVLPIVFVIMIIVSVVRFVYLRGSVGDWTEMILVLPIHALLPLLPIMFPVLWKVLNYFGQARLLTAFEICKEQKVSEGSFDSNSVISVEEARVNMDWKQVLHTMWLIVIGRSPLLTRQANIMHVMGSVTSFCCVDKKGVLSWANPTAEKVFFMTKQPSDKQDSQISTSRFVDEIIMESSAESKKGHKKKRNLSSMNGISLEQECHFEVLDLTHDAKSTFGLQFDDPTWQKNITSLKPLGLSILLNTCNSAAKAWYSQFTDHVASSAVKNKETVAVVNRRCLCELARQMGFSEKATILFDLEQCFGMYKQVPAEEAAKEKMHRAHSTVQHKIPMPNMVSVVVKEHISGMRQLMSQGTADMVLDSCSDYWDGTDLQMITESDRKKILDFYHRTSMVSYCTAFSYRPMPQNVANHLRNFFIELPEDSSSIYPHMHAGESSLSVTPENSQSDLPRSLSADTLVGDHSQPVEDIFGCFSAQCNQVFIGMVTMQYQARQDIVQLIDQLETACIRFVHFSEENELRSRVFSEKMGLEAGWNCHISLLPSDGEVYQSSSPLISPGDMSHLTSKYSSRHSTDTLNKDTHPMVKLKEDSVHSIAKSYSAPSLINMETTQVKFCVVDQITTNGEAEDKWQEVGEDHPHHDETLSLISSHERVVKTPQEVSISDDDQDHQSDSHHTSSFVTVNTEDSLTAMLDNRAKLPRGIDDIRPHLENVDNVPLLVSLFTDCTQATTCEMVKIMQEYGEVVLCLGSSVNINNTGIFLQADASVSVQPLLPQICARQEVMIEPWEEDKLSPVQLASTLLTLPCSLFFKREDNIHFVQLIAEARHYLMMMRNCFQFMLCCQLSLSLIQVLSSLTLHLPPVLSSRHILWLLCVVIPSLSLTMMGNQVDTRIMMEATGKNNRHINKEVILQFLLYYGLRFVPSVAICLVCCGLNSVAACASGSSDLANRTACLYFQSDSEMDVWNSWEISYREEISLIQNFVLFQLVLYFVLISMSYVHKYNHVWQSPPFTNRGWLAVCITLLLCQLVYFVCDVAANSHQEMPALLGFIPVISWGLALGWPLILVAYTELVKMQEIKLWVRYQKRARLNFGTKLGMNSPF